MSLKSTKININTLAYRNKVFLYANLLSFRSIYKRNREVTTIKTDNNREYVIYRMSGVYKATIYPKISSYIGSINKLSDKNGG